ncbi:MAG: hypothetical protein ABS864_06595 [Aerococcus urinaeequi]
MPVSNIDDRKSITHIERSAFGTALGAFGVVAVIGIFALLLHFLAVNSPNIGLLTSENWASKTLESPLAAVRWFFGDMTEAQFYKSDIASFGLLAGAVLAWLGASKNKRWSGAPISYGSGLWPWVLAASSLSLLISNLSFGWALSDGWQPTFVPFVCVATGLVLIYGGGWKVCITAAVLGAVTTTPLAMVLIALVTTPLGIPVVVANVLAMSIGAIISFLIVRLLPWFSIPVFTSAQEPTAHKLPEPSKRNDVLWAARRVLQDFTEAQFYANEWASIGVILGVSIAFVLNPALPGYGSKLIPHLIFAQALTSAIGIVIWRKWYRNGGWAGSYISLVSVTPAAVLAYNGSLVSIVAGALLGAIVAPPIGRTLSSWLPSDFHPFIGNTFSMAISTTIIVPIVGLANSMIG